MFSKAERKYLEDCVRTKEDINFIDENYSYGYRRVLIYRILKKERKMREDLELLEKKRGIYGKGC